LEVLYSLAFTLDTAFATLCRSCGRFGGLGFGRRLCRFRGSLGLGLGRGGCRFGSRCNLLFRLLRLFYGLCSGFGSRFCKLNKTTMIKLKI
jgi:hypothetical protein